MKDSCRCNHEGLLYVEALSAGGAREQPQWSTQWGTVFWTLSTFKQPNRIHDFQPWSDKLTISPGISLTCHLKISSDPFPKSPSNPNSGQSGAVHSLTVQRRLLRSLPPMRGPIGKVGVFHNFLQCYSVCTPYKYHLHAVSPAWLDSQNTQYGVCTMPPPSKITQIPEPEVQTTRRSNHSALPK